MADRTHLHRAAQRGDIGAVRALVQAVDVNITGGWRVESPLHAASRAGRPDVIAVLMAAGANTEVRDRNNDTPLLLAAWLGQAAAVAKLIACGARVDADGIPRSALHCACMQGHVGCVAALLRGGADERAQDEDGNTPAQVVGTMGEALERAGSVVLIHRMLQSAPADRAWHRRGWLAMLRARDTAAAVLRPPPRPPLAVTTRGAERRAVVKTMTPTFGSGARPEGAKRGKRTTEVVTRGSREGRAGEREKPKSSKHSSGAAGSRGQRVAQQRIERDGSRRGARAAIVAHARMETDRQRALLASLVRRLIDLGEEGAFRCVLSFL